MINFIKTKLLSLNIDPLIIEKYNEEGRYYHNINHIIMMIKDAIKLNILNDKLFLAIIFHDIIYNVNSSTNEEKSVELFSSVYNGQWKNEIMQAIIDTKLHISTSELGKDLCILDMNIFNKNLKTLIEYENNITKEYSYLGDKYKEKRIAFLKTLNYKNIQFLINYIENK
jgi:predicted metal-dependent HD superfamily phosphohydrolase